MAYMRRIEVLEALKEADISERGLAEFFALTDEQFELWDRICWKPLTEKQRKRKQYEIQRLVEPVCAGEESSSEEDASC
jgi:hypothetical protein